MKISIIQFTFILTIIFVIAKLIDVIAWSWWLVFLPAIIGVGIGILIIFLLLAIMVMAEQMERE